MHRIEVNLCRRMSEFSLKIAAGIFLSLSVNIFAGPLKTMNPDILANSVISLCNQVFDGADANGVLEALTSVSARRSLESELQSRLAQMGSLNPSFELERLKDRLEVVQSDAFDTIHLIREARGFSPESNVDFVSAAFPVLISDSPDPKVLMYVEKFLQINAEQRMLIEEIQRQEKLAKSLVGLEQALTRVKDVELALDDIRFFQEELAKSETYQSVVVFENSRRPSVEFMAQMFFQTQVHEIRFVYDLKSVGAEQKHLLSLAMEIDSNVNGGGELEVLKLNVPEDLGSYSEDLKPLVDWLNRNGYEFLGPEASKNIYYNTKKKLAELYSHIALLEGTGMVEATLRVEFETYKTP